MTLINMDGSTQEILQGGMIMAHSRSLIARKTFSSSRKENMLHRNLLRKNMANLLGCNKSWSLEMAHILTWRQCVSPEKANVWAKEHGLSSAKIQDLCDNEDMKEAIIADLERIRRSDKSIKGYEVIKGIVLYYEEFSASNNLATPTLMLKRSIIQAFFMKELEQLYRGLH